MLYTGKGDKGDTGLYGKEGRVSKASAITEALGALDECNSFIGLCRAYVGEVESEIQMTNILHDTQEHLFIVQAHLAGADKIIGKEKIKNLEEITDTIEKKLPPITTFTITGNSQLSAMLDVTRTLVRKAERRVVSVQDAEKNVHENVLSYLNRLSSLFFALARYTEHIEGVTRESPTYE